METILLLRACVTLLVVMTTLYTTEAKLVDLSHDHGVNTSMSVPTNPKYKTTVLIDGDYVPGVYVKSLVYSLAEHGGTHIDAPVHFSRTGHTLEQIPLENTIADGVMIDCAEEAGKDPEYTLPLQKIKDWEKKHGQIPQKAAVLINFNWSRKFLTPDEYFGTADVSNTSTYTFPVVGLDAATFLLNERDILILGTDTMSPDSMQSLFPVHVLLLGKQRIIVENVKDIGKLPPKGFRFHTSPVKFVGGSGVQVRAYAIIHEDTGGRASAISGHCVLIALVFLLVRGVA